MALSTDDLEQVREDADELMGLMESIKRAVRMHDRHLYERWKAGGFLVDPDIVSMYPNLNEVVDSLVGEEEAEE